MNQPTGSDSAALDKRLRPVLEALERFQVMDEIHARQPHRQADVESALLRRQQDAELARRLSALEGADAAQLLEMLPGAARYRVWDTLPTTLAGEALEEVTGQVAEDLVGATGDERLVEVLGALDPEELSALRQYIPAEVFARLEAQMEALARRQLRTSSEYPLGSVGALMGHDFVSLPVAGDVASAVAALRERQPLPEQTDQVFLHDEYQRFAGAVTVTDLLLAEPDTPLRELLREDSFSLQPEESGDRASQAFERYDLISVPVVDRRRYLIGRLTVESVMDHVRERAEDQALASAGLSEDSDLFGPIWRGARERWPWLATNLLTAFVATRFIALFEGSLQQLVSLAVLMPIIASIGGNAGNQTIALFVRGLALEQIKRENSRFLLRKELAISLINGTIWGGLLGGVATVFYRDLALGLVMAVAMTLNLVVAALVGVAFPLLAARLGRDPALGSSVVLTFTTDSMGFLIFLGLATLVLL
ncbi:magnesium transporter [Mangrovimicrobium sediminis]|uniref:Magnesium transporter n=1 Tax=Mangrovimicrobium sediminis TaxID=2562682 RepID=A0A4Z0M1K9_9GAMM|nr:magnesium transporter [Haliea sp. SAOS-164]TGD73326.1 magnesium transporter [Haliea sp. SAOS-164]